ncbi:hypothetical protein GCM10029992_14770 [Glycomyces albus]
MRPPFLRRSARRDCHRRDDDIAARDREAGWQAGHSLAANPPRRSVMPPSIRHITPVDPGDAEGAMAEVYRQARDELGAVGATFAMLTPAPEMLAAMWSLLRESSWSAALRSGSPRRWSRCRSR